MNTLTPILSDALVKGAQVRLIGLFGIGPREGTIVDGKKGGIARCVQMQETNGHYADCGDTYIDEITSVLVDGTWRPFALAPAHAKKMRAIRAMLG